MQDCDLLITSVRHLWVSVALQRTFCELQPRAHVSDKIRYKTVFQLSFPKFIQLSSELDTARSPPFCKSTAILR